jgi:hypothetical protein
MADGIQKDKGVNPVFYFLGNANSLCQILAFGGSTGGS